MSSVINIRDYSPALLDDILISVGGQTEKDLTRQIIKRFVDAGLTIKVKHLYDDRCWASPRVLCFIKKSEETVIVNTKTWNGKDKALDGLSVQLRILNNDTFHKLNDFSDRVRDTIVNAYSCKHCSSGCKRNYTFSYQGADYSKCQFLCNNFWFRDIADNDVSSIMQIIDGELRKNCIK